MADDRSAARAQAAVDHVRERMADYKAKHRPVEAVVSGSKPLPRAGSIRRRWVVRASRMTGVRHGPGWSRKPPGAERTIQSNGHVVQLQCGQLCHSARFMARAWGWERTRVQRFLAQLAEAGLIELSAKSQSRQDRAKPRSRATVISVCNYARFHALDPAGAPRPDVTSSATGRPVRDLRESVKATPLRASKTGKYRGSRGPDLQVKSSILTEGIRRG